jgi:hypothetical protein
MIIDPILRAQNHDRKALITEIFNPTINLVENFIKEFDILNIFAKIRMIREFDKIEAYYAEILKSFLIDRISNTLNLTLSTYSDLLHDPLNDTHLEHLYWSLLHDIVNLPFYNLTLEQRIDRSTRHTFKQIEIITHNVLTAPDSTPDHLIRGIRACFLSYGQVSGGSALVWDTRILIGEQNRAYQMAAKAFMKEAGLTHLKWVNHPDKPLSQVCQDLEGTYLLDETPNYPYPGCTCSLEPLHK